MLITTGEFFALLVVIIIGIWLMYHSRLNMLRDIAFAEESRKQVVQAVDSIKLNVKNFRELNDEFEKFNKEQKNKPMIMCSLDKGKICTLCGNNGDKCPFRQIGSGE